MSFKVEYRGGIPESRKTGTVVADAFPDHLVVGTPGFSFKSYNISYGKMLDVSLVPEGAKKKNYVLNVEYDTGNGFTSVIVLTGKEVSQLYGSLQKSRQKYMQRNPSANSAVESSAPSPSPTADTATEIQKFFDLKEKGIISEDEFAAKKTQLLGI
ncbi:MAG: SHOCT domain-containing protein [Anaerotignum propionicum]|nr:SHOCT domain-containing protein [Anaerotignum propionicum]MEA5057735.1 SHOCT domain-containing protein [Anaerotignum propionicum]